MARLSSAWAARTSPNRRADHRPVSPDHIHVQAQRGDTTASARGADLLTPAAWAPPANTQEAPWTTP